MRKDTKVSKVASEYVSEWVELQVAPIDGRTQHEVRTKTKSAAVLGSKATEQYRERTYVDKDKSSDKEHRDGVQWQQRDCCLKSERQFDRLNAAASRRSGAS